MPLTRAQCRLVEDNVVIAARAAWKLCLSSPRSAVIDYEELRGVALEALCRAALAWDEGGDFGPFAGEYVRRRMIDWLREYGPVTRRGKKRPEADALSWVEDNDLPHRTLEETPTENMMRPQDLRPGFEGELVSRLWIDEALAPLPPREQQVIRECVMDGLRLRDLAARWGVTEARVSQLSKSGLDRLRRSDDFVRATIS